MNIIEEKKNKIEKTHVNKKYMSVVGICILIIAIITVAIITKKSKNEKINYTEVTIGENIKSDYAEITFDKVTITQTAYNKSTDTKLEKTDDKIYFIILGTVTNNNTIAFNFNSNFATKLIFDDKYEYSVTIAPNSLANIDPLEKKEFILYASVPTNIIDVCKEYKFRFGYNNNFSSCSLDSSQNKYELIGKVNQYGSAENVTNFETFSEYISKSSEKYEGLQCSINNAGTFVIVKDGNALQFKTLADGESKFDIQPTFRFSYSDNFEKKCIPSLIINFSTSHRPDNVYYLYGNTMEISSSNGSVRIEENSTNRILIDTYKSINLLETDFVFSSLDYNLADIKNIINGDNLKITVMVGTMSDDVEVTFECDDKIINSLNDLFNLNDNIIKEYT